MTVVFRPWFITLDSRPPAHLTTLPPMMQVNTLLNNPNAHALPVGNLGFVLPPLYFDDLAPLVHPTMETAPTFADVLPPGW